MSRPCENFTDAPLGGLGPQGLHPPLLLPVQNLAAAVVLSTTDLLGEVLDRVVRDANGFGDLLQGGSALLVDLFD